MYTIPKIDNKVKSFARLLGASRVCKVPVVPKIGSVKFDCHNNCDDELRTTGYVILKSDRGLHAFLHSVEKKGKELLDVSPNFRNAGFCIFADCDVSVYCDEHVMYCSRDLCIINTLNQAKMENDSMYYVYALIDPRSKLPFYVGKGKGERWKHHLGQSKRRNDNWFKMCIIEDIRKDNLEPGVEFLATSILDEQLAYDIEALYIKQFKKRSEGGLLVNICDDNRPPNHKGKTYEEIYGPEEAKKQKEKRVSHQLSVGGYGPKIFSKESREKISKALKGNKNSLGCIPSDQARANMRNAHVKRIEAGLTKQVILDNGSEQFTMPFAKLKDFCMQHNLSFSTFSAQIYKSWPRSKRGKNKGWLAILKGSSEVAVDSYLEGAIKNDIKEGQFNNFSL